MILGIGSDICDIERIESAIARHGERFLARAFTDQERTVAESRAHLGEKIVASTYAKRFAAKEAAVKALDIGKNSGISWQDIEVVTNNGVPSLVLHGAAHTHASGKLPPEHHLKLFLSLSDDYPYALAFVILEAVAF